MASVYHSTSEVAFVSGNKVTVFSIGSGDSHVIKSDAVEKKTEEKKSDDSGTDRILAGGYSTTGQLFALCDDHKVLSLWKTGQKWTKLSSRQLTRRCTSLRFTRSDDAILVADKSGDAYSFSATSPTEDGQLLLGHVSMLLDLEMCGDSLVATSDRDEKIRISHYPNAHSIEAFCLGHKDFVSQLHYNSKYDMLVSGSGDGTLRLWDYHSGTQLSVTDCCHQLTATLSRMSCDTSSGQPTNGSDGRVPGATRACVRCMTGSQTTDVIVVSFYQLPVVLVYSLRVEGERRQLEHTQTLQVDSEVWHVSIDSSGHLWVVLHSRPHVAIYGHDTKQFVPLCKAEDKHHLLDIVDAVNSDTEFFQDAAAEESLLNVLLNKRTFDSAKDPSSAKRNKRKDCSKEDELSTAAKLAHVTS